MNYAIHPGVKADQYHLPVHIAIIMDGNGRWASSRQLSRTSGHRKGVEVARDVIFYCQEKEIVALTLFAFGVENWKRPRKEIRNLFRLFYLVLKKDLHRLHEKNIRLRIIGDRSVFTQALSEAVQAAEEYTRHNTGLCLNVAINYSGRWDLMQAVQKANETGSLFTEFLSLAGLPEPDLFIRTGGVKRISNFILWELAYTELYFTPIHWPDFTTDDLKEAFNDFASRERRFGLTSEQVAEPC